MGVFSKESVNTGRQLEIDVLKTICIVGMIVDHVLGDIGVDTGESNLIVDNILTTMVGAAGFMLCMGIGMKYARNQSAKAYLIRGFAIMTVGQLLNLLRNAIPNLIGYWITGSKWCLANSLLIIQADILTFAGLAFLLIALFKRMKLSDTAILVIGFGMNLLAWLVHTYVPMPDGYLLNQFIGFFFITKAESYFPLFCYFTFVAAGFFIGGKYPYIKDKGRLSTMVLVVCLPVDIIYYYFRMKNAIPGLPEYASDLHYSMNPGPDAIATTFVSLCMLAVFYKLIHAAGDRIPVFLSHPSENINAYYCISYMFILPVQTILMASQGHLIEGSLIPLVYSVFVLFASAGIIELNKRKIHFSVLTLRPKTRSVLFITVWVLTVAIVIYVYPQLTEYANIWNDYLCP